MILKEQIYSTLLVSPDNKLNITVSQLLASSFCNPVNTASNISAAKRILSERSYDFIIINSPLPDDTGIGFAKDLCTDSGSAVLLIVGNAIYDDIRFPVSRQGVFTMPKPFSAPSFAMALDWLTAARERIKISEEKAVSVEKKLEETRIVNRAKWLLITKQGLDEPSAHRLIEKKAMDGCVSKKEIAEEIIRKFK